MQCKICQHYHKKNLGGKPEDNPCFVERHYKYQYPPNARMPEKTIIVTCKNFTHINGGRIG